jgi:hypothetical protein
MLTENINSSRNNKEEDDILAEVRVDRSIEDGVVVYNEVYEIIRRTSDIIIIMTPKGELYQARKPEESQDFNLA